MIRRLLKYKSSSSFRVDGTIYWIQVIIIVDIKLFFCYYLFCVVLGMFCVVCVGICRRPASSVVVMRKRRSRNGYNNTILYSVYIQNRLNFEVQMSYVRLS